MSIQGDIATVKTDIGELKVDLSSIDDSQGGDLFWLGILVVAANVLAGAGWAAFMLKKH